MTHLERQIAVLMRLKVELDKLHALIHSNGEGARGTVQAPPARDTQAS